MLQREAVKDERALNDLVTALAFRERELEPLIRPLPSTRSTMKASTT